MKSAEFLGEFYREWKRSSIEWRAIFWIIFGGLALHLSTIEMLFAAAGYAVANNLDRTLRRIKLDRLWTYEFENWRPEGDGRESSDTFSRIALSPEHNAILQRLAWLARESG